MSTQKPLIKKMEKERHNKIFKFLLSFITYPWKVISSINEFRKDYKNYKRDIIENERSFKSKISAISQLGYVTFREEILNKLNPESKDLVNNLCFSFVTVIIKRNSIRFILEGFNNSSKVLEIPIIRANEANNLSMFFMKVSEYLMASAKVYENTNIEFEEQIIKEQELAKLNTDTNEFNSKN